MFGLQVELCHRGVPLAEVQKMGVSLRKSKLKELEARRLVTEQNMEPNAAAEVAKKHLKLLSTAVFQFTGMFIVVCVSPQLKSKLTENQTLHYTD